MPLPQTLLEASPFWMLIFYMYWLINCSPKEGFQKYFLDQPLFTPLMLALFLGALVDILHGDILGQNSIALILSSIFIIKNRYYFSMLANTKTQQVYVFSTASIYLCSILLIHTLTQGFEFSYYLLLAPFASALFWPVIKLSLSKFQH